MLMANNIANKDSNIYVCAELSDYPRVPKISGYRPDVYGRHVYTGCEYICEAKTFKDLETTRSNAQIQAFLRYLKWQSRQHSSFILGGYGQTAVRAKTLLRFAMKEVGFLDCSIQVFDGLDRWILNKENGETWHLY